jgi:Fe-S oxidoreductase
MLQPELAKKLLARKVENIEKLQPQIIATGNIGRMTQIATGTTRSRLTKRRSRLLGTQPAWRIQLQSLHLGIRPVTSRTRLGITS